MIGIFLSLVLLIYLAYRGISVLILAPLTALLAALINGAPILGTYTQVFMPALGGYVIRFFPLFLLGAIFGKLMEATGSAEVIANAITRQIGASQTALAVVLACAILTYGGVSLFVVAFTVFPIAGSLFAQAGHPKRFIPAALSVGSFTFTMTALPGSPAIQNAIPSPYFGTDTFAAPGLGIIAALIMGIGGTIWVKRRIAAAVARGETYGEVDEYSQHASIKNLEEDQGASPPSTVIAFTPIAIVIVLNLVLSQLVLPTLDTRYLSDMRYGGVTLDDVRGIWSVIGAVFAAILVLIALNWKRLRSSLNDDLKTGINASLMPIFNTASEVGYGAVIASLPAFAVIAAAVTGIAPGNPLISEAIAVNLLAGITGSASGGLSIALETFGPFYFDLAEAAGLSPELLHRVAVLASGGFDSLPHSGGIITLLAITGLTHKKSYPDIFVTVVLIPVVALVTVIALGTYFGSF